MKIKQNVVYLNAEDSDDVQFWVSMFCSPDKNVPSSSLLKVFSENIWNASFEGFTPPNGGNLLTGFLNRYAGFSSTSIYQISNQPIQNKDATKTDKELVALELLKAGISPFVKNSEGVDALDYLLDLGAVAVLEEIKKRKDFPSIEDFEKRTVFSNFQKKEIPWIHFLVFHGDIRTTKFLLDMGVNPNLLDEDGTSPLGYAHHAEMAELLLSSGANPSFINNNGKTISSLWNELIKDNKVLAEINMILNNFLQKEAVSTGDVDKIKALQRPMLFDLIDRGNKDNFSKFFKKNKFSPNEKLVFDKDELSLLCYASITNIYQDNGLAILSDLINNESVDFKNETFPGIYDGAFAWIALMTSGSTNADKYVIKNAPIFDSAFDLKNENSKKLWIDQMIKVIDFIFDCYASKEKNDKKTSLFQYLFNNKYVFERRINDMIKRIGNMINVTFFSQLSQKNMDFLSRKGEKDCDYDFLMPLSNPAPSGETYLQVLIRWYATLHDYMLPNDMWYSLDTDHMNAVLLQNLDKNTVPGLAKDLLSLLYFRSYWKASKLNEMRSKKIEAMLTHYIATSQEIDKGFLAKLDLMLKNNENEDLQGKLLKLEEAFLVGATSFNPVASTKKMRL